MVNVQSLTPHVDIWSLLINDGLLYVAIAIKNTLSQE